MVIGICGGSGSGKTTILKRLAEDFKEFRPSVFSMDNYYKPIQLQQKDENNIVNFDLPTALDREKLIGDLRQLISGESIDIVEYQFNVSNNKHVLITLDPSELVIVEGIFVFEYQEVFEMLDYSIFIDVDLQVQLDRRLYRDQENRGYSREDVLYQWKNHVTPCYTKFIAPHETKADFIFHNDSRADKDYELLLKKLKELVGKKSIIS
jgi:uridine kinase